MLGPGTGGVNVEKGWRSHSARDNASTAGTVTALAVPSTLCHLLHLVHARRELQLAGRELDKPCLGQNELRC